MGKKNLHNSKLKKDYKNKICSKSAGKKLHNKAFALLFASGVFSTGATGAIAPIILRKRPTAPVILHLPDSVIILMLHMCAMQAKFQNSEKFSITFF